MNNKKNVWKRKLMAGLFALIIEVSAAVPAWAADEVPKELNSLFASSAVLMDGKSGRILFEKNGQEIRPMASTTKIMTCILALENGKADDVATASAYAAGRPKVHLGVKEGEQFYLGDLLYSLMLESHNDAAVMIAEKISGSVEEFAELMNEKAGNLGCENTYFITPNGLDAEKIVDGEKKVHSTTAADLARIMKYCITESPKKEAFLNITRTPSYSFTDMKGERNFSCVNHNAFLSMMEGALSGKTGFTANAGYCYVGALKRDGKLFIVALLACGWPNNKGYKWKDTQKLMEYGLGNYTEKKLSDAVLPDIPDQICVKGGCAKPGEQAFVKLKRIPSEDVSLLMREGETARVRYVQKKFLSAPVKKGEQAGILSYTIDGKIWKKDMVVTTSSMEKTSYRWCFKQVLFHFLVCDE